MQLPMFPVGSVLFPGAVLPLQVFEPRYRALVADVAEGDGQFGVVLINRGSDVGGGDERTNTGSIADLVRNGEAEDGRILIVAVGRERIRVRDWLEDDPYPRAIVEPIPKGEIGDGIFAAIKKTAAARRRLLALAIEMGAYGQNLDLDLPADPDAAVWSLCEAAPVGSFDRQRLIETADAEQRLHLLEKMMSDQTTDLVEVLRRG
jgi:Lon protease-like protein